MKFRKTLSVIVIVCGIFFLMGASGGSDPYGNDMGTGEYGFGLWLTLIGVVAYGVNEIISKK